MQCMYVVHPNEPTLGAPRYAQRSRDISCPDRRSEAVPGSVDEIYCLTFGLEGRVGNNWPKYFILSELGLRIDVKKQFGLDKIALFWD